MWIAEVVRVRAGYFLVVASVLAACTASVQPEASPTHSSTALASTAPATDPAVALRRPIVPQASTGTCRPASGRDASEVPGAVGFAPGGYVAFGSGPIYPAFVPSGARELAVLNFDDLSEPSWLGKQTPLRLKKVLWIAAPGFRGDVLVRVVPGSPGSAFGHVDELPSTDKFFSVPGNSGGYIYFSSRGCYAFQIDGADLSMTFTIEVR